MKVYCFYLKNIKQENNEIDYDTLLPIVAEEHKLYAWTTNSKVADNFISTHNMNLFELCIKDMKKKDLENYVKSNYEIQDTELMLIPLNIGKEENHIVGTQFESDDVNTFIYDREYIKKMLIDKARYDTKIFLEPYKNALEKLLYKKAHKMKENESIDLELPILYNEVNIYMKIFRKILKIGVED